MTNSSLGAALTIPQSALDAIEQADKKLKDIQDTAKNTASSVTQSFKDMSVGTKPFLDSLDQVIAKLATINASAANASNGISNVGASAGNMNNNITSAAQNIQNMVAQLSKMNGSGTSGIMQAALAFQRLQESAKGASGMNIAGLKQEIGGIESILKDTSYNLTKTDQDALIKRKKNLEDELKYQQQMYEERVIAFQKALDKMVSAESSFNAKQRKAAEERAKMHIERNKQENTSYEGSLKFADSASTLNRMTTAVSYLNAAKKQLSVTDENYDAKVQILDAKIHNLTLTMKQLSMTTEQRIAAQKAVDKESEKETNRAIKEDAANQKRIQSIRALNAEMNRQRNFETNTSFSGSLKFADTANTYNRQAKAVEYLTIAKKSLSQTDSDYQSKVDVLTSKISSLTNSMKERMMTSEQIAEVQKKIDDEIKKEIENYAKEQDAYRKRMQALREMRIEQSKMNNYKANTTIEGALKFSDTANTINRRTKAIQYLQEARSKLSSKSKTYADDESRIRKAIDRLTEANRNAIASTEELARKRQIAYEKQARLNKENNYKKNTTYDGALNFSATANTLNRQVRAIEYLKEARMKLSQTDADYKRKLDILNAAIEQHNKNLKEAGVNSRALTEQTSYMAGYMSRWAQRMAFAFSVGSIKNFVEQIASVRGQFELSERSLEAILQNKPKADEIFNKTVELAVKSPFRIKDLVDYTRQLSAYRIESDKLYDTTKRLADVSAGLGVDMGRLILAYGQVKAAAYLRGSEVRQFTEAGINMYGELQQYFKEVKGEAYTTAQIVDMISKRKVTFEDVEAIFQRMTDKGGTFYNMQEIQAETLQGKISNLKDAFDVMLNDIGKANEGTMKGMVSWGTSLLDNWKTLAEIGKALIPILIAIKANSMFAKTSLGQAFSQASGTGIVRYKALFVNSLDGMKKALKDFGGLVKSSLSGIGVGLAIYAVAEVITTVYDKISKYKENVRKAEEETIKAKGAIGALAGTYNDLANAATNANSKLGGKDLEKNIEDRRTTLQKIIDAASKDGLTFKINVDTLDVSQLNTTFSKVEKEYKDFIDSIEVIRRNYAKNDAWNTWFTDGLDDDADDYKDAVIDALAKSSQMERVVANINANYKQATSTTKKYFDEIRAGQKDNESNIDYMTRMYELIKKINIAQGGSDYKMPSFIDTSQADFNDLIRAMNSVQNKAQELNKEFDAVFGDLRKKFSNDPIKIQGVIDRIAAERDWSQYERDLAYRHFGINVYIDRSNMEKQVSWVDDYINDFFAKKKYGISLVVKEIDDDKAFEGFLGKGDQAAKAAKSWKEVEKRLAAVGKNSPTITIDDTIRKIFKAGEIGANQMVISVAKVKAKVKELKQAATQQALALGVNPFESDAKKNRIKQDKAQRDILQERISLLKDMNSKYNELIKTESKETALSATRKYFKEAAQNVGWRASDILPDDASVAKRIREIGSQYKELTKRGNAFRISADIDLKVSEKEYNKLKDDISRNVNDAFSQVDLYKKLKDEGMSDELIKSMFGDLTKSFDEVQEDINNEFNKYIIKDYETHYGKDFTKWGDKVIQQYNSDLENTAEVIRKKFSGSDVEKEYLNQTQKLNQKIKQDTTDTAQKLFKEYKQRLSDQLQFDRKYIADRIAIMKNFSDPETQKKLLDNIDLDYKKKTGENTWKDFKNSDMYVRLFDNLDQVSSKALDAMAERLQKLRTELRDLDPTELKTIAEQINKVNEVRNSRNPFKAFTSGLKEMIKASKDLKKLGGVEKYVELNGLRADLTSKLQSQNAYVESLEQEYNELTKINGADESVVAALKLKLATNKSIRDSLKSQLNLTDEQIAKLGTIMTEEEQAKAKFSKSVTDITDVVSTMANSFDALFEALSGSDANLENTLDIVSNIGQAVGSYYSGNYAGVVSGAMGALTGVAKLFSNEGKIDKEIARQERAVNSLQHAYEKLKKSMDDAFDTQKLYEYNQKSVDALKKQQKAYQAMINAERGRKKPDEGKIQEWEQQIDDLNTTIQELGESMTEALGGFGSQSNYKSAAEAFSEAWVDAFNEGSDALEALNNKFDEYFNTMLTKQLMNRATSKYIQPILEAFDKAVSEGSEGGNNGLDVTKKELEGIKELKDKNLALFNEYAKNLMDVLNVKPAGSSNISALQQGIQSVTESTAQALESILNSLRYYVATQQADVRIIRDTLLEKLGNSISAITQDTSSSPVLIELRLQTTILTDIRDTLASCVKGGHKQGRNGIKVFMN
jgi:DNA repair exonuclease SbcCD ATPase subunit